jgi:TrmH family RNA methyltransferase
LIRSLSVKKYRLREGLFVVEGDKMVRELLESHEDSGTGIREIIATESWLKGIGKNLAAKGIDVLTASGNELRKVSNQVSPQEVLALVSIPDPTPLPEELVQETILGLEAVRDPGNLGTILRTADWFGIRHIICSHDSVDLYNPKVIQSTMGAYARVRVYYADLKELLASPAWQNKMVYGTYPRGTDLYDVEMDANPIFLFGNESRGLSVDLEPYVFTKLSVPSCAGPAGGSESLNLASSVAVVCSEYRRKLTRNGS